MKAILVSVDNGNKQTKTIGLNINEKMVYDSGYVESKEEPLIKEKLIKYRGMYYSIGQKRFPVLFDKTENDSTFILTLPAIANAIKSEKNYASNVECEIILAVGLPLSSFGKLKTTFANYFKRKVEFQYEGITYLVNIKEVLVFPQGYAAYMQEIKAYKGVEVLVFDIGGYTVDCLKVKKDATLDVGSIICRYDGIITLFNSIQNELRKQNISITEEQIQDLILKNQPIFINEDIMNLVDIKTEKYVENLMNSLKEEGFDTSINPVIFSGGGALLLKSYLEKLESLKYYEFQDQFANSFGYKLLAEKSLLKDQ
ncbi:ParM/StbA family protein [Petrocella sp. FN5]|uniref:ParM/StbA family protein n=1 Tax=Petrocella sp. FN5 TaxID=3032002 RepID=UPI0023DB080B|nr:ParM/StbA family protein [Petrocella sp. FN5]MDF1618557.1 ParM/StbA family protein [Petrocella sp. FN5]